MSIDWGDAPAWAAFGIALISALFAFLSWKTSVEAKEASKDSATAAERSADAAEEANQLTRQQLESYDEAWKEIETGVFQRLRNTTGRTVYNVRVRAKEESEFKSVAPGESVGTGQQRNGPIKFPVYVEWSFSSEQDGERHRWSG